MLKPKALRVCRQCQSKSATTFFQTILQHEGPLKILVYATDLQLEFSSSTRQQITTHIIICIKDTKGFVICACREMPCEDHSRGCARGDGHKGC